MKTREQEPNKNDQRNLMIALALSVVFLFVWQYFYVDPIQQQQELEAEKLAASQPAQSSEPSKLIEPLVGDQDTVTPSVNSGNDASARAGAGVSAGASAQPSQQAAATKTVRIESAKLTGSINLIGASFDSLKLKGYRETIDKDSPIVSLLNQRGTSNSYFINFGWAGDTQTPNAKTEWQVSGQQLSDKESVTLSWTNPDQVTFEQVWSLDENYMFRVTQRVINNSAEHQSITGYGLISRSGVPPLEGFAILHEGLLGVFNETLEEVDYDEIADAGRMQFQSNGGWLGFTDKYWLTALVPDQNTSINATFLKHDAGGRRVSQTHFVYPSDSIAPRQTIERTSQVFAGAKQVTLLDRYRDSGIALFDRAIDFGWYYFMTKPLFLLLNFIAENVVNLGIAIIILTLIVRLALFPLANKSFTSMSKMKQLQPQIAQLRETFGGDKNAIGQEMMKLYKREGVNPLSGCLPIMIQIPVFFSLYKVFFVTIEMRHAPFFGWIHDLSAPDPAGILTAFGLIDWQVPSLLVLANVGIWPILMGLTMWLQQKLNPKPTDPIQAKIFSYLPFLFTFLLGSMPAGLVVYWTFSNTFSIAQQWFIMRRMGVKPS